MAVIRPKLENPKVTFLQVGNKLETSTTSISKKYTIILGGLEYEIAKIDALPHALLIRSDSFHNKDIFYCFDTLMDILLDADVTADEEYYIKLIREYEDSIEFEDFN
jgi:hypothetical protein